MEDSWVVQIGGASGCGDVDFLAARCDEGRDGPEPVLASGNPVGGRGAGIAGLGQNMREMPVKSPGQSPSSCVNPGLWHLLPITLSLSGLRLSHGKMGP